MRIARIFLSFGLTALLMGPAAIAHAQEPTPDVPTATQTVSPEPAEVETPAESPASERPPAPEPFTPIPANAKIKSAAAAIALPNSAPVAVDDHYTVVDGHTLTIDPPGFLANDSDPDGDSFDVDGITIFSHDATSSILTNGYLQYTPDSGFIGDDTASYNLIDEHGNASTFGTITITVTPPNHAPVAAPDHYTVAAGETLTIPAPGLLANDTDADADTLTAGYDPTSFPHAASFDIGINGNFSYTPEAGFTGDDIGSYVADDAHSAQSSYTSIIVTVTPAESPVSIVEDEYAVGPGETLTVNAPGVLGNDVVPVGSSLGPCTDAAHGTATCHADGSFTFTPDAGFSGDASFVYPVNGPVVAESVRAAALAANEGLVTIHVTADDTTTPTDPADPATPSGDAATLPDTGAALPPSFPVLGGMLILAGLLVLRQPRRLS